MNTQQLMTEAVVSGLAKSLIQHQREWANQKNEKHGYVADSLSARASFVSDDVGLIDFEHPYYSNCSINTRIQIQLTADRILFRINNALRTLPLESSMEEITEVVWKFFVYMVNKNYFRCDFVVPREGSEVITA